ncbi:MAG TPA: NfeD family protein [Candidatus Udaeobacter sp.]|nr:NfeD family protein [Candidatus Udaeobacter sp.]
MGNWVNWLLVIGGIIFVIIELVLGALTGFDLALVGASLAAGGIIGLLAGSANVGLLGAAGLALVYFAVLRSWLKSKLTVRDQPSNVDAVIGKAGVVTKRIASRDPGLVKVGAEEWRAELATGDETAREVGATITVSSVEGVTLKVR